ncbi:hypothetical protein ISF_06389 [Cordyceps fumosorosea ARSEF 2679]|uniref:Dienelactone hydrolase domain-containing protein n=1 Tax=Cordyceps fumosorosea (strain ARSEF 2679) TaxID=1081104 RepID=A0A167SBH7_CORFA|nr:hypothetical protein ISF_06389 [Cordyceps fumosorosea ARSEF 2679]OAA59454.1 hypothetical protein ISF_06389 [Cordyceps fumosorosea ARSEF 2679]
MKSILNHAAQAIMALAAALPASAQNLSYGADNFYRSEQVAIQPISFKSAYNATIVGNLFTRKNMSLSASSPAIVVGHPMGAVKEQSANLYATKMAEQGFVALTLDLPFFGRSDGPQSVVSPDVYTEAYRAAVDHLGAHAFVDRERIGALGICGSGGFVINAAKIDARIRAVATVSMYDMGAVARSGLRGAVSAEQRRQAVARTSRQRWAEVDGAPVGYSDGLPSRITNDTDAVTREFYDFYRTARGEFTPEGWPRNQTIFRTTTSNIVFLNFYPFNDIDTISPRPLLIVAGDQAHSREFSDNAYDAAAQPKELYWVQGASHTDLRNSLRRPPCRRRGSGSQPPSHRLQPRQQAGPAGARSLVGDRLAEDGYAALDGLSFDAVVDTWAADPSAVKRTVAALRDRVRHYAFVSQPQRLRPQGVARAREAAASGAADPHRPPRRSRRGPRILSLQFIDGRDLAAFLVDGAERRLEVTFDAVSGRGHVTLKGLLAAANEERGRQGGAALGGRRGGGESYAFIFQSTGERAAAAGLKIRPALETVKDTWEWVNASGWKIGDGPAGIPEYVEADLVEKHGGGLNKA